MNTKIRCRKIVTIVILIFETMHLVNTSGILRENTFIRSEFLQREVVVDFFLPGNADKLQQASLLFINDGQDLEELGLSTLLDKLYSEEAITPLLCVGIHANEERKMEYGVAAEADYMGRGAKAGLYTSFIIDELLPFIFEKYKVSGFKENAFAGFSLGGLGALDIVWNHPDKFCKAGVFSGSFWWRSVDQTDPGYEDDKDRIMQQQIRKGKFAPGLKFFFQCGNKDETKDRNGNGIIDSVDDTLDLIKELEAKGYDPKNDIEYLELKDGRHDIETWGKAMPSFLKWGWKK